ncbi:MAG: inositol monophosphatase family protein [Candidatus Latescibacterota bacterium]
MANLTQSEKNTLFAVALEAVKIAGGILRERFGKQKDISYKGRIDPVTDVDIASEKAILEGIRARYPDHDFITEESSLNLSGSPFRWIIDPLDGTVNYAHDYPVVAVSIGLEVNGVMEIGVVYNPIREELFRAVRGEGAFMNDTPIHVSRVDTLVRSLLATGFPYDIRENPRNNIAHFGHMALQVQGVRRDGSAALNCCYTAMGRLEGYWELTISPWDIAAGSLIITEAGGKVTDLAGGPFSVYKRQILSSNGLVHDAFVREIQAAG